MLLLRISPYFVFILPFLVDISLFVLTFVLMKKVSRSDIICHFQEVQVGIYTFKVNNRNTRTRCEICLKLTIKTTERRMASRKSTTQTSTTLNPSSASLTKWSNTLNCLSEYDHFVGLQLEGLQEKNVLLKLVHFWLIFLFYKPLKTENQRFFS